MKALGLDIGTTTICLTVIDAHSGATIESTTVPNDTNIAGEPFERLQDPAKILAKAQALVDAAAGKHSNIASLGVAGQMHGILYVDAQGNACSPLATWQDQRGLQVPALGVPTGYGCATHYYNLQHNEVPADAVVFCTIQDYVAMKLAGASTPLVNVTNAASFGLFDIAAGEFTADWPLLPCVTAQAEKLGETPQGIPVFCAIGDNQASLIGSVREPEKSILVNVGTGSQISFATNDITAQGMEIRPMPSGGNLAVGAALCGGRAYATLETFFRQVLVMAGIDAKDELYSAMNALAMQPLEQPLAVDTRFGGTRANPALRGAISGLGLENFMPAHFTCGVLQGIVNELHDMYRAENAAGHSVLVASGNAVRKGEPLRRMFAETFGMPLHIPAHNEEAAYGAALFGLTGAGVFATLADAQQRLIKYV
ncbi:MAG: FGGY family carbohydrate kinase [Oscillospiraceae bacterium]|nr:FGGY family carbohydrate kinase [Oscillospiraceae bacterium]